MYSAHDLPLTNGARLGPYEILSPLGAGGMGEVYKARDTRLERTVAVKVLPTHMASSPEARQRFEREAKTISQLSHPHICALYDVGREGETEYLVMELLEGETLSARLAKGRAAARADAALRRRDRRRARQGAPAGDRAPGPEARQRDADEVGREAARLRPGQGHRAGGEAGEPDVAADAAGLTQEGTILGTFQYMAPEQLEGRDADGRTDVFAFGAVLYEMATGKKAFSAASQASLITAIMSAEPPPISSVQPMSPPALDRVVKKCLAKDPEDRWQNAARPRERAQVDRRVRLAGRRRGADHPRAAPARRGSPGSLCGLFAVTSAFLAVRLLGRASGCRRSIHAALLAPGTGRIRGHVPELSPDGRSVVFGGLGPSDTAPTRC